MPLLIHFSPCILLLIGCCNFFETVEAHGRLLDPPSRATMWRKGFKNPANYDDNGLWCGGQQYYAKVGKCGVCGDKYGVKPEPHAAPGGKYANGIIVKTYNEGEQIKLIVEMTKSHKGYMQFRLCVNNDKKRDKDQSCFDQNLLQIVNGKGNDNTKFPIGSKTQREKPIVKLPSGVTCEQCILQWTYVAGNNWKVPDSKQETFRACADISITGSGSVAPIIPKPPPNPKYPCGFPKAWKDKVCDDENNNAACFWDGGDCCGANVNTKYCEECKCLDPNAQPPPVKPRRKLCENPAFYGDGVCDDGNNNEKCNWDGGDCCGKSVNTYYCRECQCLDPKFQSQTTTTTPQPPAKCDDIEPTNLCKNWKSVGICHKDWVKSSCPKTCGGCNSAILGNLVPRKLGSEGKDTCSDKAPENLCMQWDCKKDWVDHKCPQTCHNCSTTITDEFSVRSGSAGSVHDTLEGCRAPKSFGDGFCDDDNNNEACSWDGGDCCGNDVKTDYCFECKCLDPCVDKEPTSLCENWRSESICNKDWVKEKCGNTCNVCFGGAFSVRGGPDCQNQAPSSLCQNWKSEGLCSSNAIKFKCAKTCGNCN